MLSIEIENYIALSRRGHRVGFHHGAEPPPSTAHGTPSRRRECNQYKDAADPDTGELDDTVTGHMR